MRVFLAILLLTMASPFAAMAASVAIADVPTNWRLENYLSGPVMLWFTPSQCTNRSLTFTANATPAEMNRLWALILAAKLSSHKVFVYYDNAAAPTSCPIISFGMDG
jgi:hypothetical protein